MSRRGRDGGAEDALELFLDTISNVFGGVVFIALAVVILLQFSSPTSRDVENPDSIATVLSAVRGEIETLELLLRELPAGERVDERAYRATLLEAELAENELAALRQQLKLKREEAERARNLVEDAEQRLAGVEQLLLNARTTQETAPRIEPEQQRVGRFRTSDKQEIPVMLRHGRLVEVLIFSGGSGEPVLNRRDLEVDTGSSLVRPAPGAGREIGSGETADRVIIRWLAEQDPQQQYLSVAVWPDAFAVAIRLREHAQAMGFELTLTPIEEGQGVPFRASSGVQ